MSKKPSRTASATPKKPSATSKTGSATPKTPSTPKPSPETVPPAEDEYVNLLSFNALLQKWFDYSDNVVMLPLKDIKCGGYRPVTKAGIENLRESLATNAGLVGEQRHDGRYLRTGIKPDHYIMVRLRPPEDNYPEKYETLDGGHRKTFWEHKL